MKFLKRLPVVIILVTLMSCSDSDNPSSDLDGFKNDNCSQKWTQQIIDAAVKACVKTNNSKEDCTCSVETTAKQFTICETEKTENFAKMAEISLNCGIKPSVD